MRKFKLIKEYPGSPELGVFYTKENFIGDFGNEPYFEEYPEFWQEVVEKDYEILSVVLYDNYNNIHDVFNGKVNGYELDRILQETSHHIHSVKRLSDSEIFMINDLIDFNDSYVKKHNEISKIKSFRIEKDSLYVDLETSYGISLNVIKHVKQPLFTTEDGVEIYEGDKFYYVKFKENKYSQGEVFEAVKVPSRWSFTYEPEFELYFSTKEKAEEYILLNKPVLSINDITTYCKYSSGGISLNKIITLVQQKIKNN